MKSAAFFEILLFAFIAFILIKKLLDVLGQKDEDGPSSFGTFANKMKIRNVEEVIKNAKMGQPAQQKLSQLIEKFSGKEQSYSQILAPLDEIDKKRVIDNIIELENIIQNFKLDKFLQGAQGAYNMLIDAFGNHKNDAIDFLVTKDFARNLQDSPPNSLEHNLPMSKAEITDVTKFGNSAFIKVVFSLSESCQEEWTFTKNINNQADNAWKISNIIPA